MRLSVARVRYEGAVPPPAPRAVVARLVRSRVAWVALATVVLVGAAALLYLEPWRLVTSTTVDEAAPVTTPTPVGMPTGTPAATAAGTPVADPTTAPAAGLVARGSFLTHEHPTRGTVAVLRLADGSRVLRVEGLRTSDGPDLRVWLSAAPVLPGRAGWRVFADAPHVELGRLKGNRGNQNYAVPADVDLATLGSITIWCVRFSVSFGAAALRPVTG